MSESENRPQRHDEIEAILNRKPGVVEARDEADRYTVVGAASRQTYANWLTPIEEHFVCHRNPIPEIDTESWSVSLTGLDREVTLPMSAIREEYPTVAIAHTMECAGNGRGQHEPETSSVQWDCEAVGTAIWTGTPLRSVLRTYGVTEADERWVTAIGSDSLDEEVFARSIPLSKILDDCILAYEMNSQPLPPEHGFPVRLIVPGWYGVNNVKWVEELRIMDSMVTEGSLDRPGTHAQWQQASYRIYPEGREPAEHETIDEVDTEEQLESDVVEHPYTYDAMVMSLIGAPEGSVELEPDGPGTVEILGVAWAGDDAIERVEISTDGGDTWNEAEIFGPDYSAAWRLFSYDWAADPGTHTLMSRATDDCGRTQPTRISDPDEWSDALEKDAFPWNEGGYAANAYVPNGLEITVVPSE